MASPIDSGSLAILPVSNGGGDVYAIYRLEYSIVAVSNTGEVRRLATCHDTKAAAMVMDGSQTGFGVCLHRVPERARQGVYTYHQTEPLRIELSDGQAQIEPFSPPLPAGVWRISEHTIAGSSVPGIVLAGGVTGPVQLVDRAQAGAAAGPQRLNYVFDGTASVQFSLAHDLATLEHDHRPMLIALENAAWLIIYDVHPDGALTSVFAGAAKELLTDYKSFNRIDVLADRSGSELKLWTVHFDDSETHVTAQTADGPEIIASFPAALMPVSIGTPSPMCALVANAGPGNADPWDDCAQEQTVELNGTTIVLSPLR